MMPGEAAAFLGRLISRARIEEPVAMVVAHPDDEVLAAGGMMPLFDRLLLIHLTDGAPRDGSDARVRGFADAASYAAERRRELADALAAGNLRPGTAALRCVELGAADQEASLDMLGLAEQVRALLAEHGARQVLTHPYEGGHPDHDAAAFITHLAVRMMPEPPSVIETTSYHAGGSGWVTGRFLPGPADPVEIELTADEQTRKRTMLACFRTQADVLAPFGTKRETFRPAPSYDFSMPPHPGALLYEGFGWGWTGPRWRALAAAAVAAEEATTCGTATVL